MQRPAGQPAQVYCFKREEVAAGSPGLGTRKETGAAEEVPAPLSCQVREAVGARAGARGSGWQKMGRDSIVHVDLFIFLVL